MGKTGLNDRELRNLNVELYPDLYENESEYDSDAEFEKRERQRRQDEEEFDVDEFDRRMRERTEFINRSLKEGGHKMPGGGAMMSAMGADSGSDDDDAARKKSEAAAKAKAAPKGKGKGKKGAKLDTDFTTTELNRLKMEITIENQANDLIRKTDKDAGNQDVDLGANPFEKMLHKANLIYKNSG